MPDTLDSTPTNSEEEGSIADEGYYDSSPEPSIILQVPEIHRDHHRTVSLPQYAVNCIRMRAASGGAVHPEEHWVLFNKNAFQQILETTLYKMSNGISQMEGGGTDKAKGSKSSPVPSPKPQRAFVKAGDKVLGTKRGLSQSPGPKVRNKKVTTSTSSVRPKSPKSSVDLHSKCKEEQLPKDQENLTTADVLQGVRTCKADGTTALGNPLLTSRNGKQKTTRNTPKLKRTSRALSKKLQAKEQVRKAAPGIQNQNENEKSPQLGGISISSSDINVEKIDQQAEITTSHISNRATNNKLSQCTPSEPAQSATVLTAQTLKGRKPQCAIGNKSQGLATDSSRQTAAMRSLAVLSSPGTATAVVDSSTTQKMQRLEAGSTWISFNKTALFNIVDYETQKLDDEGDSRAATPTVTSDTPLDTDCNSDGCSNNSGTESSDQDDLLSSSNNTNVMDIHTPNKASSIASLTQDNNSRKKTRAISDSAGAVPSSISKIKQSGRGCSIGIMQHADKHSDMASKPHNQNIIYNNGNNNNSKAKCKCPSAHSKPSPTHDCWVALDKNVFDNVVDQAFKLEDEPGAGEGGLCSDGGAAHSNAGIGAANGDFPAHRNISTSKAMAMEYKNCELDRRSHRVLCNTANKVGCGSASVHIGRKSAGPSEPKPSQGTDSQDIMANCGSDKMASIVQQPRVWSCSTTQHQQHSDKDPENLPYQRKHRKRTIDSNDTCTDYSTDNTSNPSVIKKNKNHRTPESSRMDIENRVIDCSNKTNFNIYEAQNGVYGHAPSIIPISNIAVTPIPQVAFPLDPDRSTQPFVAVTDAAGMHLMEAPIDMTNKSMSRARDYPPTVNLATGLISNGVVASDTFPSSIESKRSTYDLLVTNHQNNMQGTNVSKDRGSPELGWVAVSKSDVITIVDSVFSVMADSSDVAMTSSSEQSKADNTAISRKSPSNPSVKFEFKEHNQTSSPTHPTQFRPDLTETSLAMSKDTEPNYSSISMPSPNSAQDIQVGGRRRGATQDESSTPLASPAFSDNDSDATIDVETVSGDEDTKSPDHDDELHAEAKNGFKFKTMWLKRAQEEGSASQEVQEPDSPTTADRKIAQRRYSCKPSSGKNSSDASNTRRKNPRAMSTPK